MRLGIQSNKTCFFFLGLVEIVLCGLVLSFELLSFFCFWCWRAMDFVFLDIENK